MAKKVRFEEKYAKLEALLQWFESNDFNLDEADEKFLEGIKLIEELTKRLSASKLKVSKLEAKLEG
jgi:exodeoxyribonuclease VII small subunit